MRWNLTYKFVIINYNFKLSSSNILLILVKWQKFAESKHHVFFLHDVGKKHVGYMITMIKKMWILSWNVKIRDTKNCINAKNLKF